MDLPDPLENELRRRILGGTYPAGSRLPSRRTLQNELATHSRALQTAFDQLIEQGFIEPRGSQGSFVARVLPHQSSIALVFACTPQATPWNRFWSALEHAAETPFTIPADELGQGGAVHVQRHYLDLFKQGEAYEHLVANVTGQALAGIIFASQPYFLPPSSPLLTIPLPRVCITSLPLVDSPYGASLFESSYQDTFAPLLQRFHDRGRRRLAVISYVHFNRDHLLPLVRAAGIDTQPQWWHALPTDGEGALSARTIAHLLGTLPARQRPDCLLITDDQLVQPATQGILDARLTPGIDLDIAAHANFPLVTHAAAPCLRYGLDAHVVLRTCVDEIRRLAGGAAVRQMVMPLSIDP